MVLDFHSTDCSCTIKKEIMWFHKDLTAWSRAFCMAIVFSICPEQGMADDQVETSTLRVMTFNIRFGTADDGENSWSHRRDFLVHTIRQFDPDILGLQEALPMQIEFLQQSLPSYDYVGRSREKDNPQGEQCALLIRRERFEIKQSGTFWLSETPEEVGSKSWDAALPRIATWVELVDRWAGGWQLRCFNVHLDHVGQQSRLESARLLRARIEPSLDRPLIVLGDFNAPDDAAVHDALVASPIQEHGLTNALRNVRPNHAAHEKTFHAFQGPGPGKPVDWILFNGRLRCLDAAINEISKDGRYPSDHFPVQATLRYEADACTVK